MNSLVLLTIRSAQESLGMADYYPVLARAVSSLATNTARARQELYEHARSVLNKHLDRSNRQISNVESINERIAFEAAVLRLESKSISTHETLTDRLAVLRQLRPNKPISHNREFGLVPDIASQLREPVSPVCLRGILIPRDRTSALCTKALTDQQNVRFRR
jgi:hypothetical protein